jgi:hypothetical protein
MGHPRTKVALTIVMLTGLTVGCSSNDGGTGIVTPPLAAASSSVPVAHTPTAATAHQSRRAASDWNHCGPNRDLIVRSIATSSQPSAQKMGRYNLGTCQLTLDFLRQTSPTEAGYCTQAAWASDNPGYKMDVTPARPLRKVIEAIGPAC